MGLHFFYNLLHVRHFGGWAGIVWNLCFPNLLQSCADMLRASVICSSCVCGLWPGVQNEERFPALQA